MQLGRFGDWLKVATVFGAVGVGAAMLSGPLPAFDIVSHARIPIGALLAALGLLHLPARRPRWAAAAFLAAGLSIAPASAFFSPPQAHAAGGRTLRVLFHNAWMRNEDPARVLTLVRSTRPDIVALIEVRRDWRAAIDTLADIYPYRVMEPRYGETVILSKTPLEPFDAPGAGASIVFADIAQSEGPRLRIAVTHFTRPWPWDKAGAQRDQLARFAEAWRANGEPDIVVGDFNGAPWSAPLQTLSRNTGLRPAVGAGGTWPTFLPAILRLPIDNAFVGPRVRAIARRVRGPTGSDHAPVLYDVTLAD
ncbi:MAG: endonuclease/exonuclease/phosphatase family protein [Hyphomonadaceae bacterium]|nr:MAG: endonuclease/exonuclease/phosphatase [Caulobacteraceae bacterium]MBT9446773.1 endonuclease/exonuclease/phosphatase family protein [Hyphomonadaceae bacterium]TPW03552.1 MAG: endonuclease/exonuclease/phosphatase [Alphaproteobacteria bacterium]